jgi:hypothetical protein
MLRRVGGLAWILIIAHTALLGVVRLFPYSRLDLRNTAEMLLPPEGCPAPCFMGIRPEVTTRAEALAILENHAWVEQIVPSGDLVEFSWVWSNDAPQLFSRYHPASLDLHNEIVDELGIFLATPLWEIHEILGSPTLTYLSVGPIEDLNYIFRTDRYDAYQSLALITYTPCESFTLFQHLNETTQIRFGSDRWEMIQYRESYVLTYADLNRFGQPLSCR